LESIIKGKAYVLGENIDTDQIIPAHHLVYDLDHPKERVLYGKYAFSGVPLEKAGLPEGNHPFVDEKRDLSESVIVIAGKNFGCGSSREHAPVAMQMAGVRAVVSLSFARIFYRNAVDGGYLLPLESEEDLSKLIKTGDYLKIELKSNILCDSSGDTYSIKTMGDAAKIIDAGGIFAYARMNQLINRGDK